MVNIGGAGKGKLFAYDVDVSRAFRAEKGQAIITLREPSTQEYLALAKATESKEPENAIEIILKLIVGTTIQVSAEDPSPVNLDVLKQAVKDNGTLYLFLYQEWQKMLPFDARTSERGP